MAPHVFPTLYQEKIIAFSLFFRPAAALQFHLTRTGRKIFLRGGLDNKQFRRKKRRGKSFFVRTKIRDTTVCANAKLSPPS